LPARQVPPVRREIPESKAIKGIPARQD
jgi:hypothetical protein